MYWNYKIIKKNRKSAINDMRKQNKTEPTDFASRAKSFRLFFPL